MASVESTNPKVIDGRREMSTSSEVIGGVVATDGLDVVVSVEATDSTVGAPEGLDINASFESTNNNAEEESRDQRIQRVRNEVNRNEDAANRGQRYRWEKSSNAVPRNNMDNMGYKGGGLGRKENGTTEALFHDTQNLFSDTDNNNNNKKRLMIFSDSMFKGIDKKEISKDLNIDMHCHGGCTIECMYTHVEQIGREKTDFARIHVGTSNCTPNTSDEVIAKLNELYEHVRNISPLTEVFLSLPTIRLDDHRANSILGNLNKKMRRSRLPHIEHINITESHLSKGLLHLSERGKKRMTTNLTEFFANI